MPAANLQIVLEGIDQSSAVIKKNEVAIRSLGQATAVANEETVAASAANATLSQSAEKTAATLGTTTASVSAANRGLRAMHGIALLAGTGSFPQLTGAVFAASGGMQLLAASSANVAAKIGPLSGAIIAAALATQLLGSTFNDLRDEAQKLSDANTLDDDAKAWARELVKMRNEGQLTAKQVHELGEELKIVGTNAGLRDIRKRTLEGMAHVREGGSIEQITSQIESLNAALTALEQSNAIQKGPLDKGSMAGVSAVTASLVDRYGELISQLRVEQKAYQIKLGLTDEQIKKDKTWLNLQHQVEDTETKRQAAAIKGEQAIRAEKAKTQALIVYNFQSANMLAQAGADAARLYGEKGFAAWKAFAYGQAIINAALAITNEAGQGDIYSKIFRIAAIAAVTGVQIATIANTQPSGYAEGGYTGHGGKFEPAGIVHRGEFVLSREAVARIGLAPLEGLNGGRISAPQLSPYAMRGYASGGFVSAAPSPQNYNFALIDNRQDRRDWQARKGMKVLLGELQRRGNKIVA